KSRRNKSAPGPDGIPYRIFKMCSSIRSVLFSFVRMAFRLQLVPQEDRVALKVLIPKGGSRDLGDFRDLTLFNTTLKTVMGVWSRRVRKYMLQNRYFNTSLQKGFLPKISGCVEHNHTVIDLMRNNIKAGNDAYIIWLDLQNAFGSVKHNLMFAALKFYGIPDYLINIIMSLYKDCSVKVKTKDWTTESFRVEKGSLQGGPEAGLCFNISWNLGLDFILLVAVLLGCREEDKPVAGFADDVTLTSGDRKILRALVRAAENFCTWAGLRFKDSKCKAMGVVDGSLVNPLISVNGKVVPAMHKLPFKFLGRMVYPKFDHLEEGPVVDKFLALMKKTDDIYIDNRKKAWIYENGVLPAMSWDFMIYRFTEKGVSTMEACVNRLLKKWLGLCKSADPSILYRTEKGLGLRPVRAACMKAQVCKEVILCCSKDRTVRTVASSRREEEQLGKSKWKPSVILDDVVQRVTYRHKFKGQNDRRGLGHNIYQHTPLERKDLTSEVKTISEEDMIPHILSLAEQSKWTKWDKVIDLDLKWKEILYGMSPSMLSFILNSVQNTLPHPINLRRWKIEPQAICGLCNWKNAGIGHILCGCKFALQQGRISYRHDSILKVIEGSISRKAKAVEVVIPAAGGAEPISFVASGKKVRKKKKVKAGIIDSANDWIILMDLRQKQTHFPPHIITTTDRPDLVMYSDRAKVVVMLELTSP
ncbi:MAG: hypothetical protein GY820_20160, partial [Gammaproteobacteria bacterium]|nr:hypothetical protein [Gammaproteobacteria bacterium]